jgi:plasmid stabilization system protein ParE
VSDHRKSYILTATAARNFREARRWSVARWGKKRTKLYFQQLHEGAEYIATHQPAMAPRDDLTGNTELGVYPVGEHYLVYAPIGDTQMVIVALFRQTRDVPTILEANSYRIRRQLTAALDKFRTEK